MDEGTQIIDLGFVNAFLVRAGEGYILIDSGMADQWDKLESILLKTGCLPDRLKLVIATHGDVDHTGNCAELQQKYGARIAMHAGDAEMVKSGVGHKRHANNLMAKLFLWLGSRMRMDVRCFQPDLLLEDGQSLAEYGWAAKVLHTPGHTPGSIAILCEDGQLFAGDTLSNRSKPGSAPLIENDQELQASLALLKQTNARIVYPGHGKPFPFEALAAIK